MQHTQQNLRDLLIFICQYHELEKAPLEIGYDFIRDALLYEHEHVKDHSCDQWRWKKKDFGDWYLNLDAKVRVIIYNKFGIEDPDDIEYLASLKKNPTAALFKNPSNTYTRINNLMMFFFNHGINEKPEPWLTLSNLPESKGGSFSEKNPRYGNSKNWAKYILKQCEEDQLGIVKAICENYQTDRYRELTNT